MGLGGKKVFVIEHCENCQMHQWNTRHDLAKYKGTALEMATAIKENVADSEVVMNLVPKVHAMSDIYCQLIPNDDEANEFYEVVPRIGSFEISINGTLLFSKCLSGCWPHAGALGEKAANIAKAIDEGQDLTAFQTTGVVKKQKQKGRTPLGGTAAPEHQNPGKMGQQMQHRNATVSNAPQQNANASATNNEQAAAGQRSQASIGNANAAAAGGGSGATGQQEEQKVSASPSYKEHNSAEELQDLACFFKPDTKSLLSKHLSQEIWDEYKDKSCNAGVTFKTCVFSGVKNLDSGIGLYAGSHGAYSTFNKLFDKVIEEYHGHKPGDKHVSDMNAKGLQNAEFSTEDLAMINSTRIRVGRNLADFPLGPGVSKEQRLTIMSKVVEACKSFEGDLEGTFYPLEGMSKEDSDQLIADHFLFKEGDRFLKACNLNRDWPSGRGIYHNDAKTFLIWVNEEDQLRIISMEQGGNIAAVFDRLCRGVAHISEVCKFAHDDHLGYITSCPTNLGTALRASVHIKLPKLMKNKELFNQIADKYYVQIRGIHGEHTETNDGVFDISNRRRLGRSEKELVQDMINGVRQLIDEERKL